MKRNGLSMIAAALLASCLCCGVTLTANAQVTVEDIVSKARELGAPELKIQEGLDNWNTGYYDQSDLDDVWEQLLEYEREMNSKIDSIFDSSASVPDAVPDDSKPERDDFVNMTLDEKIAYVNSLPPAEREAFLNTLSPEERKSILKQMSIKDKADLMEGYVSLADKLGMNVVVDDITDDNVMLTIRDDDGVIIDQSGLSAKVEDTGVSYTGLFAAAAAGVVLAGGGLIAVYRHLRRTDEETQ